MWWAGGLSEVSIPSLPSLSFFRPAMQKTLPQARSRGSQHRVFDCCRSFQDLVLVYLVLLFFLVRFLGIVQTPNAQPKLTLSLSLFLSLSLSSLTYHLIDEQHCLSASHRSRSHVPSSIATACVPAFSLTPSTVPSQTLGTVDAKDSINSPPVHLKVP